MPADERKIAEKESKRWLDGAARAAEQLGKTASVVLVADRESAIYPAFGRCDLLVRAGQELALADPGQRYAPEPWP